MTSDAILAFLIRQHHGVVSTVGPDGRPQAAVVGLAFGKGPELVFDTLGSTNKARNLRRDKRVAVVFWEGEKTVQLEGVADEPTGEERERVRAVYLAAFPDGAARLGCRVGAWPRDADSDPALPQDRDRGRRGGIAARAPDRLPWAPQRGPVRR